MRIDAKTCKVVEERSTGGVYGQASFTRLVDIMRAAGEIKADETITQFDADPPWLRFKIEKRHD